MLERIVPDGWPVRPITRRLHMKRTANHATELRTTFRRTVDSLRADLASPCGQDTRRRWNALADLARRDLPLARLIEAHLDAVTINDELNGPAVAKGQYWGVWAAEPPDGRVAATVNGADRWRLSGTKRWCSGAHLCSHALITAHAPDGHRLFVVDLTQQAVSPSEGDWVGNGMAPSAPGSGRPWRRYRHRSRRAAGVSRTSGLLARCGWRGSLLVRRCRRAVRAATARRRRGPAR